MSKEKVKSILVFKGQIEKSKKIALISHKNPDTDALSSLVALKKIIEKNYPDKIIDIFAECESLKDIFKPILKEDNLNYQTVERYDLAIGFDSATKERFGKYSNIFDLAKDTAQIDHHSSNEMFARNNIVYMTSSTTEVLYLVLKALHFEIPNNICKLIYAGMITDTSEFTQGVKRKSTIKVLNDFYNKKVDMDCVLNYFFKSNPNSKNILLEKALHSMKFYFNGGLVIMTLDKKDFLEANAKQGEEEGIINQGINTKGVNIACIFIKRNDNQCFISMRSKYGADVSTIAKQFGGGGHSNMAAFTYNGDIKKIAPDFFRLCKRELVRCKEIPNQNIFFDDNSK